MNLRQLLLKMTAAFWAIPAVCAVTAIGLAVLVVNLDRGLGDDFGVVYGGGPDSARAILSVVASSVLTFAALTFSITIVALQLASSQFSPRVLRSLLRDRWTQGALGIFVGTFIFALLTLREVRAGAAPFVPGLGVSVSLLLALASVASLMGFIHHMAQSLRVVTIIDRITSEARRAIDAWYADERYDAGSPPGRGMTVVAGNRCELPAPGDGVLTWFDRAALVEQAQRNGLTVELLVPAGTWVGEGQPLLVVHGTADLDEGLRSHVAIGRERETPDDPAYAFRQLVDIAERALSPGVNDPTTAVQCLDRMHGLLRRLAVRDLAVGETVVDGVLRFRAPVPDWADYLGLACNEIRHWGAGAARIHRRLEWMLNDLGGLVEGDRALAVQEQLDRLGQRRGDDVAFEIAAMRHAGDPAEWFEGPGPSVEPSD